MFEKIRRHFGRKHKKASDSSGEKQDITQGSLSGNEAGGREGIGKSSPFEALYTLAEGYPENDVAHDVTSQAFRVFAASRENETDMTALYADFLALKKAFSPESDDKPCEKCEQGTTDGKSHSDTLFLQDIPMKEADFPDISPRAYSGFSGGRAAPDYGASLSARQMSLAKLGGMSYREYAELLDSVPKEQKGTKGTRGKMLPASEGDGFHYCI